MSPIELNDASGFRYYSEGVVTEVMSGGKLKVSPLETLNAQPSGHIVDNITKYEGKHPNDTAQPFGKTFSASNVVEAEWVPLNAGNRVTAPSVQKNERVMLMKFANVDKFYWIDKGFNPLRRLETVEYRFSGLKDWSAAGKEAADQVERGSSYYFLVDTVGKRVEFGTSAKDEEMTTYAISIDTARGILSIGDGLKNTLILKSDNGKLEIKTMVETSIISEKRVSVKAPVVAVEGDLYVSGEINCKGMVKHGGLSGGAKSAPAAPNISLAREASATALMTSGVSMNNPFALSMLAGSSQYAGAAAAANPGQTTTASAAASGAATQPTSAPTPAPAPAPVSAQLTATFNDTNFA